MAVAVPKMNWENYHRLETIYAFMDELALDYPELCTISCIGTTEEGRGIKARIYYYKYILVINACSIFTLKQYSIITPR